jgi:hypothetical protein
MLTRGNVTMLDISEQRLRMRAYQNVSLEFKRVLVWKEILVIIEYTKNWSLVDILHDNGLRHSALVYTITRSVLPLQDEQRGVMSVFRLPLRRK